MLKLWKMLYALIVLVRFALQLGEFSRKIFINSNVVFVVKNLLLKRKERKRVSRSKITIDEIEQAAARKFGDFDVSEIRSKLQANDEETKYDVNSIIVNIKGERLEVDELLDILERIDTVNVYAVNEYEYVAAEDYASAREAYLEASGVSEDEVYSVDVAEEATIDHREWDKQIIWIPIDNEIAKDFIIRFGLEVPCRYTFGVLSFGLTFTQAIILDYEKELPYMFAAKNI